MSGNTRLRGTSIALALIALLAAPAACGRYGEPSRGGAAASARRAAVPAPALQPADGGESGEECPPDAQQTDEKARTP